MAQASSRAPKLVGYSEYGRRVGETHHQAVISDALVDYIRSRHEEAGVSAGKLARALKLPFGTVNKICTYERRATRAVKWKRFVPVMLTVEVWGQMCFAWVRAPLGCRNRRRR